MDVLGAKFVILISLFVLFMVSYIFYQDQAKETQYTYSLGESLVLLKKLPDFDEKQLKELNEIKAVKFKIKEALFDSLKPIIDSENFKTADKFLNQVDLKNVIQSTEPRVTTTSFAMIAFSCIVFIMMGFFCLVY